jgi:flagellar motor switch protein FliN/FliY
VKPTSDPRRRYAGLEQVPLRIIVRVGRALCTVGRLAGLERGDVVRLDRAVGAPFELQIDGRTVGWVEPVAAAAGIAVKLVRVAGESDEPGR